MENSELVIVVRGSVERSNFDTFKESVLERIRQVKTELNTDEDFATAAQQSMMLKAAEVTLKEAKQSAIDQAEAIQTLFAAIDDVSEEARQTRLALDRQIRSRTAEIKEAAIEGGLQRVQALIDAEADDFAMLDAGSFLDRSRFTEAIKGRRTLNRAEAAIDLVVNELQEEIEARANQLTKSVSKIEEIAKQYRPLFQDRRTLLNLPARELELEIEKRIAVAEATRSQLELDSLKARQAEVAEPALEPGDLDETEDLREHFQIIVEAFAKRAAVDEIADSLRARFAGDPAVRGVKVDRVRAEQ